MEQTPMSIKRIPLSGLSHDPDNARARGPRAVEAIARSLEAFGQQKPIVVSPEGIVLAGNGTLDAAMLLGWTELDAFVTDLPPDKARAYAVADNRTAELAYWKDAQLLAALEAARNADLLDSTAFDENDLLRLQRATQEDDEDTGSASLEERPHEPVSGVRSLVLPYPEEVYEDVAAAFSEQRKAHGLLSNSHVVLHILGIDPEAQV